MDMRKKSPIKFYSILIGSVIGLIIIIVILNCIIKYFKSNKRKGYMSQMDSEEGGSNRISNTF